MRRKQPSQSERRKPPQSSGNGNGRPEREPGAEQFITVWAGAQRPFGLRSELASRFELEESAIRVVTPDIGGGFGGKSIFAPAAEAARLARIAGRPVRVAYTRAEEQTWATFRPAALIKIRSGFRNDGTLTAWQCDA